MKICIVGAGALGCTIGSRLSEADHEVWLIDRNAAHVDAMNRNGLRVREADEERLVKVRAASDCSDVGGRPADLVIVLVKSQSTRTAIESAAVLVGSTTVALSLQNGLGQEDILSEVVGADRVIAGKTYVGGVLLGPGHIVAGVRGKLTQIGELDGAMSTRIQAIAAAFNVAGLETHVSDNIVGAMWDKLLVNVATGALTGLTRLTYGELYAMPELKAVAVVAVSEAMAVARRLGVELNTRTAEDAWTLAAEGLPAEFKTSMLQSLERGAPTEIDFINGAVVRRGAEVGVPTPVNETLVACIKGVEAALMRSGPADVKGRYEPAV